MPHNQVTGAVLELLFICLFSDAERETLKVGTMFRSPWYFCLALYPHVIDLLIMSHLCPERAV